MKHLIIILFFATTSMTSCQFFEEEKEPEILISKIDGEEYMNDMKSEINSRKNTRLIEDGKSDLVNYESLLNIADSLSTNNNEWRMRYFEAINIYNKYNYYATQEYDYKLFSKGIFNLLMYHPKEFLQFFEKMDIEDIDFWNERLSEELEVKLKMEGIYKSNIIAMSQDHCDDCAENQLQLLATIINTFAK